MSRTRTSAYAVLLSLLATLAGCGSSEPLSGGAGTQATRIGHVFVVIMENKDYGETFGADTAAPFLARTLASQGALIESYYGIGHVSNDNYIAMISGQGPNLATQTDCLLFIDFLGTPPAVDGQAIGQGCVYPASVPNLPDQLKA